MRRRKRPETLQRVYKFRAYPVRIPEQHWVIAKSMQALWNQLVYQRAVFAEYVDTLNESARRGAWAEFEGIVDYLVRRSGLNWEWAPAVVDRFRSACIAAARGQRQPPQTQRGLRRIMIPHRFTGGGIPVEKLFSDRAERIRIERPPDGAYRDNSRANRYRRVTGLRYGLGAEAIEARVRLHREIDGLVVKGVAWCGERVGFDWEWYLTVTVEQERCQRRMTGIDCGVDVGWRQCDDGSIRMAMITDSGGHTIEARLPTYLPNAHSRRHDDSISLHGWADLRDLDRQMASLRKETDSLTEYRRLCSIRRSLYRRLTRCRNWIYENLAAWLAERYDRIAVESDLGIKKMAEDKKKSFALAAADGRRQVAAPATFISKIRIAARWRGSEIIEAATEYSTKVCWICNAVLGEQDGSLVLRCPRGHYWDQDENAARNLLSQIPPSSTQMDGLRNPSPIVPQQLKEIIEVKSAVATTVHAE